MRTVELADRGGNPQPTILPGGQRLIAIDYDTVVILELATWGISAQWHRQHPDRDNYRPAQQGASTLRLAGDGAPFGAALPSVRIGEVRSFGGAMLCVTTAAVTVTSVAPVDPAGGFAIQARGVRPNPFQLGGAGLGAEPKPLTAFPGFGHSPVSGRCSNDSQSFELGVQVTKPGADTATTHGLRVDYVSGGHAGSMVVPMTIQLCAAGDHTGHCGQ